MPISEDKIKAANNRLVTTDQPYWCASCAAGLIAVIVWPYLPAAQALTIFAILLVTDRQLSFISARFWRDERRDQRAGYWENWLFAGNLIAGTIWGLVCAVLYLQLPESPQLLLGMILILVIGGWSIAHVPSVKCIMAFSLPATASLVIATLMDGELDDYIIGLAAPVFLMAVLRHTRVVAEAYRASIAVSAGLEEQAKVEALRAEMLEGERAKLHGLLNALPAPISVISRAGGQLLYMNQAGLETFGISDFYSLAGDISSDFFADIEQRDTIVNKITYGEKIANLELNLRRADGSEFWALYSANDIIYQGEKAVIGVFPDITERRRTEETHNQSKERLRIATEAQFARLRALLDHVPANIVVARREDGMIMYMSAAALPLVGISDFSELPVVHAGDFFVDPDAWEQMLAGTAVPGDVCIFEFQLRRADGLVFWAAVSIGQMDYEGYPSVIGTFTDITERRQAEAARLQSEEELRKLTEMQNARLRNLLDSVPAPIIVGAKAGGRILYANKLGISGARIRDLSANPPPATMELFADPETRHGLVRKLEETGSIEGFEFQMIRGDGSSCWVLYSGTPMIYEGQPAIIGTFIDITARRDAEAARAKSEQMFRMLADNANDMISIFTLEGVCTYVSPSIEKLLGYRTDEFIGQTFENFAHPEDYDAILSINTNSVKPGAPHSQYVLRFRHKAGHWEWLESTSTVEKNPHTGRLSHVSSLSRLITERIRHEQALKEASERVEMAGRAKSEFIAHMSHEIRTPLNAVIGFSEMMRDQMFGPLGSPRYVEYCNDIHNSGMHLLDLINDILDLSKIEAGKFELQEDRVELQGIVDTAIRFMRERAHEKHITLEARLEAAPELWCDRRTMIQVMLNVIGNAVKFTGEHGRISVESRLDAAGDLVLSVTDTGIGIAPEDLEQVMQPFGQARKNINHASEEPGTGLGLPLSRSFVEKHGGSFAIASEPGIGTRITITLPASRVMQDEPDKTGVSAAH